VSSSTNNQSVRTGIFTENGRWSRVIIAETCEMPERIPHSENRKNKYMTNTAGAPMKQKGYRFPQANDEEIIQLPH
jgi:hypothetical protein